MLTNTVDHYSTCSFLMQVLYQFNIIKLFFTFFFWGGMAGDLKMIQLTKLTCVLVRVTYVLLCKKNICYVAVIS